MRRLTDARRPNQREYRWDVRRWEADGQPDPSAWVEHFKGSHQRRSRPSRPSSRTRPSTSGSERHFRAKGAEAFTEAELEVVLQAARATLPRAQAALIFRGRMCRPQPRRRVQRLLRSPASSTDNGAFAYRCGGGRSRSTWLATGSPCARCCYLEGRRTHPGLGNARKGQELVSPRTMRRTRRTPPGPPAEARPPRRGHLRCGR